MIRDFDTIVQYAKKKGPKTIAVAAAEDDDVLKSVEYARLEGIINAILIGDKDAIETILDDQCISSEEYIIIDEKDKTEACNRAVQLVKTGRALTIMKGFVDTSVILKAVLSRETGLPLEGLLSHVGVLKVDRYDRFFIISDSAINISPTLENKVDIIKNAVKVAHALGNENPKVAIICPVEKVNEKIISTVHAAELVKMNEEGIITGCIVGGPFALDNAVSEEAAKHKGINHPVAGQADILITPNLEVGNVLNKAMEYFAYTEKAGIIMGAEVPIILTSRASSSISKLNSIAVAVLVADRIS
ncbi:MAG: bifunctional enoyl-CoA hydratase/phosphate acetyltransferase [Clostridiaceae bacterium]|nr:bifunctional enoyl-CoA hydratase/phosphate acetyltransferase [Clostridiaceae bacterium]